MIEGALGFSQSLDQRFGRATIGAKMTDVPGHSRGLVGPLAAHGVKLLNIGVNGASTAPDVPALFVWQDPEGASLIMMYHHKDYGGIVQAPDSDLAVAVEMRGDNDGPHSVEEITKIYADLRKQFPHAQVTAANLSEIAAAVEPLRGGLPVVTQEIGDTWIYGVASDPVKVARYREVARLRKEWLAQGKFRVGDSTDCALLRRLALCAEHTWGVDTKRLKDYQHYTPKDLAAAAPAQVPVGGSKLGGEAEEHRRCRCQPSGTLAERGARAITRARAHLTRARRDWNPRPRVGDGNRSLGR